MARITQIDVNLTFEAHKEGCQDLSKKALRPFADTGYTEDFDSVLELQLDHCSDFLNVVNGPEMTLESVPESVRVMPCARRLLDKGTLPTYVEYYGDDAAQVVENLRAVGYTIPDERIGELPEVPVAPVTEFDRIIGEFHKINARVFGV